MPPVSFAVTIQQQFEMLVGDPAPAELAEKTIDYATAKTAYFNALRAEVSELIDIATSKETRPPEVDIFVAAFVVAGEEREKVADQKTLVLLKRFPNNPDIEKTRVKFERAQKLEQNFHRDFDVLQFTTDQLRKRKLRTLRVCLHSFKPAIQQWAEILRLIATIKLKEVTASDLFRRLNSYSKQHALYQALKAFGQVPKSLFILQVIDDPVLRQAIEKQLDRIEHVHRFTRAVSVGNPREFLQAEKRTRRWRKPASGSSRTASSAGTISICRKSWKRSRMPRAGRCFSMLWPTAR